MCVSLHSRIGPALLAMVMAIAAATPACSRDPHPFRIAEIAVLTQENFDELAPAGKEADAIAGDFVLRNDWLVAVVGAPVPGRDANASVRGVGGALIDLTLRAFPNDQLTAYYPGGGRFTCQVPRMTGSGAIPDDAPRAGPGVAQALEVMLSCLQPGLKGRPEVTTTWSLKAGDRFVRLTQAIRNAGGERITIPIQDSLFAVGPSFTRIAAGEGGDAASHLTWDPWFGQAYGVMADGARARVSQEGDETVINWSVNGQTAAWLAPGDGFTLTRRLYAGSDTLALRGVEEAFAGRATRAVSAEVRDVAGDPIAGVDLRIDQKQGADGAPYGAARTDAEGRARLELPDGPLRLRAVSPGRADVVIAIGPRLGRLSIKMDALPTLVGQVTGGSGEPLPCKVIVTGIEGTPTPDFGPEVGAEQIKNLIYTPDGRWTRALPEGLYEVTVSHGPEFDAETRRVSMPKGAARVAFAATLKRTVDTTGWISADFHGHTTVSGDTTSSRRGRVLNLAAEGIEFAPATEHNRLDTYADEIAALGLERHLATCVGLEMTGDPMFLNHQNAFPLRLHAHTQGNGAPSPDRDTVSQIRRLAQWDEGSEKLVQQNHPDFGWMYHDYDGDGVEDGGLGGILEWQDVIEVWADNILKFEPVIVRPLPPDAEGRPRFSRANNRVFNWLQMLNQGVRLPGVANTDTHTNFHGSGGVRNYVRCSTDDPLRIDPLEIVRSAEKGHIVMSNGPWLEVEVRPDGGVDAPAAIPGDEIVVPGGRVALSIKVQCPNWLDIDRVQVLLNGRAVENLGYTRYMRPKMFGKGSVKFDQQLSVELTSDTHIIVVAYDKRPHLAKIMGPIWGQYAPMAVSNPIFVDVDGGGFVANRDTLGHPLPKGNGVGA